MNIKNKITMIQEAYVSFEIAKLLERKGFDVPCNSWYMSCGDGSVKKFMLAEPDNHNQYDGFPWIVSRPTHQMACAWLREKHLIHIYAEYRGFFQEKPKKVYYHWMPTVKTLPQGGFPNALDIYCDNYEEAIEAALKYTLENLL